MLSFESVYLSQTLADLDAFPRRYRVNKHRDIPDVIQQPGERLFTDITIRHNDTGTPDKIEMLRQKRRRNMFGNAHVIDCHQHFTGIIEKR